MFNDKMLSLIVCSIYVMLTDNPFVVSLFSMEPKSLIEHRTKIEKTVSNFEQPREFIITREDSLFLDKKQHFLGNVNLKQSFLPKDRIITPEPQCNQYVITPDKEGRNLFYVYLIPLKSFRQTLYRSYLKNRYSLILLKGLQYANGGIDGRLPVTRQRDFCVEAASQDVKSQT